MEFVASVIRSLLSWPVALLVLGYLFRDQLRDLLGRLKEAHLGKSRLLFEVLGLRSQLELGETPPAARVDPSDGQKVEERSPPQHDPAEVAAEVERRREESEALQAQQKGRWDARIAAAHAMGGRRAHDLAVLLSDNPAAAVIAAWLTLEQALRQAVAVHGVSSQHFNVGGLILRLWASPQNVEAVC